VSVGKSKSLRVNTIVLFVCQNSRIELVCVVFKPLKIKTKYKNPSHVGLEIKTKNKNPTYPTILANKQHNSVYSERFGFTNRHLVLLVKINERVVVFSNLFYVRKINHEYTLT
jgi:hypothetical protein